MSPTLQPRAVGRADGQFDDGESAEGEAGAPRLDRFAQFSTTSVPRDEHDVNRELHEKRVDAARRRDDERRAEREGIAAESPRFPGCRSPPPPRRLSRGGVAHVARSTCRAPTVAQSSSRSELEKVRAGHDGILRDGRALGGSGAAPRCAIWHYPGGALGSMLM